MLEYIKKVEETTKSDYVNTALKKGWVLLRIINLETRFLYVLGLPYFNIK